MNKSLVAVKEQGILFHYCPSEEDESLNTSSSSKKHMSVLSYWVAGIIYYYIIQVMVKFTSIYSINKIWLIVKKKIIYVDFTQDLLEI